MQFCVILGTYGPHIGSKCEPRREKMMIFKLYWAYGTQYGIHMYPKPPKIAKLLSLKLLGTFWYPIHASCQTF